MRMAARDPQQAALHADACGRAAQRGGVCHEAPNVAARTELRALRASDAEARSARLSEASGRGAGRQDGTGRDAQSSEPCERAKPKREARG
jgi:hypothetical protein